MQVEYKKMGLLSTKLSGNDSKSISIYEKKGFSMNNPVEFKLSNHKRAKRGKVSEWSRSSRRRMRNTLLNNSFPPDWYQFGLTLTVPGFPLGVDDVRALYKRFSTYCLRLPFEFSAVWRLEVQKRGSVHWHLICGSDCHDSKLITDTFKKVWLDSLRAVGDVPSVYCGSFSEPELIPPSLSPSTYNYWGLILDSYSAETLDKYPCDVAIFPTQDYGPWLRYISDHATKSKQEQIAHGFGRHWGVINRKYLLADDGQEIKLTDKQFYRIVRWYHRLATPQIVNKDSIFGRSLGCNTRVRGKAGKSGFFANPATIKQMIKLVKED